MHIHSSKAESWKCLKSSTLLILVVIGAISVYTLSVYYLQAPEYAMHHKQITQITKSPQQPHQHVYYLKTHKTGSSTMCSILGEYCRSHGLIPLLPRSKNFNQKANFRKEQLMLVKKVKKYDMIFNHHIYTPQILRYLHNDTFFVTSLREPFKNFISAFLYYRNEWKMRYLLKVPSDDPVTEFLRNPEKYEREGYTSYTNNRQSMDLGYNLSKSFDDIPYIKHFINQIDHRFNLVLIMEYFDEGLVMLKRALHWKTEDILYYLIKNKGQYYKKKDRNDFRHKRLQRKLHARFSQADIMLYEHFLNRFEQKMEKEVGLDKEVAEFRDILKLFGEFCSNYENMKSNLIVHARRWSNGFEVTPYKCEILGLECFELTEYLQERQRKLVGGEV